MTGMEHAAHGDGVDTSRGRVDETADRVHVGMEHAIERAAQEITDRYPSFDPISAAGIAAALADAGLLAPAPLREVQATTMLGETHTRWATDWEPALRIESDSEGESWYDAEPDAMPDVGWESVDAVDRAEGDGSADQ